MDKCLFISGIGRFGSGKINEMILQELSQKYNTVHVNTQGMRLSFINACKLIHRNNLVIFSPSIAGWSVLRDLLFYFVMLLLNKRIHIVCLCDLKYSRFPSLIKKIIESKIIIGVWSPASISVRKPIKLFRQHGKLQLRSSHSSEIKEKALIYGNYLEKDKGFCDFIKFINSKHIKNYNAFGATFDNSKCIFSNVEYEQTNDSESFQYYFEKHVGCSSVYFFASYFDLAPLTLLEAISHDSAIYVDNSVARTIMKNFLGKIPDYEITFDNGFPDFDEALVHKFNANILEELNKRLSIADLVHSL